MSNDMQGCFNGRTSRASLHTHEYETCLPAYSLAVNQIDNQQLTSCVPISPILRGNLSHFARCNDPFCSPIWAILQAGTLTSALPKSYPESSKTYPDSLPIPTPALPKGGSPSLRAWRMQHSVCSRREYSEGCRACKPLLRL